MVLKTVGFGGFLASLLAVTLLCAGEQDEQLLCPICANGVATERPALRSTL